VIDGFQNAPPFQLEGKTMGVVEILAMILAATSSAVVVGLLLLARTGFIVSPKPLNPAPLPHSAHERELLRQINEISEGLPAEFWHRYNELVAKRREETLTPDSPEHQELIRLTNELECRHAERMVRLVELAKLRNTSLAEVMKDVDVSISACG
jgi:hypothetical protein